MVLFVFALRARVTFTCFKLYTDIFSTVSICYYNVCSVYTIVQRSIWLRLTTDYYKFAYEYVRLCARVVCVA